MKSLIALVLVIPLAGCSALGNVFVGHQKNSKVSHKDYTTVQFCKKTGGTLQCEADTDKAALAALAAAQALPIVLGAVRKGMKAESKKYNATYSGRGSGILYTCKGPQEETVESNEESETTVVETKRSANDPPDKPTVKTSKTVKSSSTERAVTRSIEQNTDVIRLKRTFQPKNSWWKFNQDDPARAPAVVLDLDVDLSPVDQAWMILKPRSLTYSKSKAKVAWASWWPWRWPTDVVWGGWYLFDKGIAKVDLNAQVEIHAITAGKAHALGTIDLPLGKHKINDLGKPLNPMIEKNTPTSGYLALPSFSCGTDTALPLNVRVTFMEANDLGDVIAKGADLLGEHEDTITKGVGGTLPSN